MPARCCSPPAAPALDGVNAAVNDSSPGLGVSLAHLGALIILFGVPARASLRRFA